MHSQISGKVFVLMRRMKVPAIILFVLTGFGANAQDSAWKAPDTTVLIVHKDPRIDLLVKKQAQINEETSRDARRVGKGYRLMIINTNKRDEAIAAKTKVYTYFPELKAYLVYQSPYFKLKVGNFKERKDAESYQKKLNEIFPKGVFVMNDIIELKLGKFNEDDLQL